MLRKLFFIAILLVGPIIMTNAQKKEIAQARDYVKTGKSLEQAESSMRTLLNDSTNKRNEKIWIVLFDAIRKQYENVNEQMYLKQAADTSKFFSAIYRMFGTLEGLDSIESQKNSVRGKVRYNYRKRNSEYLNNLRANLYNGGLYYMWKKDFQKAYEFFSMYIDCANQPLFSAYNYSENDSKLSHAAFYAVYNGFRTKNTEQTLRYSEIAQKDTSRLIKTYQYLAETYKMKNDTAKSLMVLQHGFARFPRSEYFFPHLFDYYFKAGNIGSALKVCELSLKADSTNLTAMFAKSTIMLVQKEYEECIAICDKIISVDKNMADAYLNAGLAYYNQAVAIDLYKKHTRDNKILMIGLYKKALPYLQTYRHLSPTEYTQWSKPLYTIYLNLNMGKEFDEIDNLIKNK